MMQPSACIYTEHVLARLWLRVCFNWTTLGNPLERTTFIYNFYLIILFKRLDI